MEPFILVLNGPNLDRLGLREPEVYGRETLEDIRCLCKTACEANGFRLDFRQTNHEGEMIEWIHQSRGTVAGLVVNAAAWTHTSLAIHDALKIADAPIVEVHLSDPKRRENFRHFSYVELVAARTISGLGAKGYVLAIETLAGMKP